MTDPTATPLDIALTAVVEQVEGVTDVFAPQHPVANLPRIVGALISGEPVQLNRVEATESDGVMQVTARIGVARSAGAAHTARDAADALLAALAPGEPAVTVQVSRIA